MTTPFPRLRRSLVAILRGLRPEEALAIGSAVFEAGIEAIEVPLNSPDPFTSIERLAKNLPASALVGAGTVLTPQNVDDLDRAGGRLLVSPNIDPKVMERAQEYGMVTMPGVFTPTEAFLALACGRVGAEILSGERARPQGHFGGHGRPAEDDDRRRGRRRVGQGFCRLWQDRRQDLRPRLEPVCA